MNFKSVVHQIEPLRFKTIATLRRRPTTTWVSSVLMGALLVGVLLSIWLPAELLWTAAAALASIGTLVFLLVELPKIYQEVASQKVAGYRLASECLESKEFRSSFAVILDEYKINRPEYPDHSERHILEALKTLEFLAKLIELNYVDRDLLFYSFADDFYYLEKALGNFAKRKNSRMEKHQALYSQGYGLLLEAVHRLQVEELPEVSPASRSHKTV